MKPGLAMKRLFVVAAAGGIAVLAPATAASAHPLGNFTVNHYDGITVRSDAVDVFAVVDAAEIPTAQQRSTVDTNHDGTLEGTERAAFASHACAQVADHEVLTVAGARVSLTTTSSSYALRSGAAGLHTSRLQCRLHADVAGSDHDRRVTLTDDYAAVRIGWHEITATADGVHLVNSPVPATSVSDELLHYPNDLLSSPLDVRSASLDVAPGAGRSTFAKQLASVPGAGPIARIVERLDRTFSGLAGARHLTLGVGMLAVLVSVLLGATHAALPGHGKTVMRPTSPASAAASGTRCSSARQSPSHTRPGCSLSDSRSRCRRRSPATGSRASSVWCPGSSSLASASGC